MPSDGRGLAPLAVLRQFWRRHRVLASRRPQVSRPVATPARRGRAGEITAARHDHLGAGLREAGLGALADLTAQHRVLMP
ncbi:hypothetical protein ACFXKS_23735 [Streptomyces scopuliridis]|uniref:hypothetical protein n=1 Tax=Streptomyces scopuliridis TaxID=452529 RepID=UPI003698455A